MTEIPVIAMVIRSGPAGQIILLVLAVLSVSTWAIIFYRWAFLRKIVRLNKKLVKHFETIKAVHELDKIDESLEKGPLAILGRLAAAEHKRILADARADSAVKDWSFYLQTQFSMTADRFSSAISSMEMRLQKGLVLLAMSSAVGPFLGLLGTVWGIMDAFYEIGEQGSASLPVIAPGIAEALITTIIGLIVAIPALFFYNLFVNQIDRIAGEMDSFTEQLSLRMKREIFSLLFRPKSAV